MKFRAAALKYPERGIGIDRINTHLCQSGRACALRLTGYSNSMIGKMVRWGPGSLVFMECIKQQISSFPTNMLTKVSSIGVFINMEGGVTREELWPLSVFQGRTGEKENIITMHQGNW